MTIYGSPPTCAFRSTTTRPNATSAWPRSSRRCPGACAPSPAPRTSPRCAPIYRPRPSTAADPSTSSPSSPAEMSGSRRQPEQSPTSYRRALLVVLVDQGLGLQDERAYFIQRHLNDPDLHRIAEPTDRRACPTHAVPVGPALLSPLVLLGLGVDGGQLLGPLGRRSHPHDLRLGPVSKGLVDQKYAACHGADARSAAQRFSSGWGSVLFSALPELRGLRGSRRGRRRPRRPLPPSRPGSGSTSNVDPETPRHAELGSESESNVRLSVGMARKPSGGRPNKGDRDSIIPRPARPLGNVVRARADEAGMTISEYVAMVLARAHGMPEYAPVPSTSIEQGVLPLSKTA